MSEFIQKLNILKYEPSLKLEDLSKPIIILGCGEFAHGFYGANSYLDILYFVDINMDSNNEISSNYPVYKINEITTLRDNEAIVFNCTNQLTSNFAITKGVRVVDVHLWNPNCVIAPIHDAHIDFFREYAENSCEFLKVNYPSVDVMHIQPEYFYIGKVHDLEIVIKRYMSQNASEKVVPIEIGMVESLGYFNQLPLIPGSLIHQEESKNYENLRFLLNSPEITLPLLNLWNNSQYSEGTNSNKISTVEPKDIDKKAGSLFYETLPVDFIKKWNIVTGNTILNEFLSEDTCENGNLGVYVLRDMGEDSDALEALIFSHMQKRIDFVYIYRLSHRERMIAQTHIRGGYWNDHTGPSTGLPYALLIFSHNKNFNIQKNKVLLRELATNKLGRKVNSLHSADDGIEALYYAKLFEPLEEIIMANKHLSFSQLQKNKKKLLHFGGRT
jgi:hypothetical protein